MISAAHRLTTGKSIGIDVWNAEDLSGNHLEGALKNAEKEGVADKIEVKNENVMQMSFADDTFDVILSNMCIHNIYNKQSRKTACQEIGRVLKTGGVAMISDWRHVRAYNQNFQEMGLRTQLTTANFFTTFFVITTVIVKK